jgi:uncharacterized membrane protein (Fun14 family)
MLGAAAMDNIVVVVVDISGVGVVTVERRWLAGICDVGDVERPEITTLSKSIIEDALWLARFVVGLLKTAEVAFSTAGLSVDIVQVVKNSGITVSCKDLFSRS